VRVLLSAALGCLSFPAALSQECQHLGLIDLKGKVIVPFEYDSIGTTPEGNFELIRYGKTTSHRTLVDHDGREIQEGQEKTAVEPVFPPETRVLARSSTGYCIRNEKGAGLADLKGKIILPCEYMSAVFVGDGFMAANKEAQPQQVIRYRVIKDGISQEVAEVARGSYYILFDPAGKKIAEFPMWAMLFTSRFSEGLLRFGEQMGSNTGFIDHSGAVVLTDPNILCREDFHDGLAVVYDKLKKVSGWIDHSGKLVVKMSPDSYGSSFSKKRSIVTVRDANNKSKFGLVDIMGKPVLPAEYQNLYLYAPNVYLALKNERLSFLDGNGKVICMFPPECTAVGRQDDVSKSAFIPCAFYGDREPEATGYLPPPGARWGYCDMSGKIVIKPQYGATEPNYVAAEQFQGNLAVVHLNTTAPQGLMGLIDRTGKSLLPWKYRYLEICGPDRIGAVISTYKFSSATWKKSVASRSEMMQTLLSQQPVIGLSKNELVQMLGDGDDGPARSELLPAAISHVIFYQADEQKLQKGDRNKGKSKKTSEQRGGFEFGLNSDDKVCGWRTIAADRRGAWIFENVELHDYKYETAIGNVLPR
jgi:hypothetical protein